MEKKEIAELFSELDKGVIRVEMAAFERGVSVLDKKSVMKFDLDYERGCVECTIRELRRKVLFESDGGAK